jgi:monothiol glutaredoxin
MTDNQVLDRIGEEIAANDVVLFMKGTPQVPQCGFSAAVTNVLLQLGVPFKGVDVLADDAIRQGIKVFSNWPTIPQVYVKGEFVGGCDIVREMYQSGELQRLLEERGVRPHGQDELREHPTKP